MADQEEKPITLADVKRLMVVVAFVSVITFFISIGLVLQSEVRNRRLSEVKSLVTRLEESVARTEASSKDVENFVDEVRKQQSIDENISSDELRVVFQLISDIKVAVCDMNPDAEVCTP